MIKDKVDYPYHVNQWKEAVGSMAAYCKEKQISYQTFMYHANRMKKRENPQQNKNAFIPLAIGSDGAEKPDSGGVEYHFTNGSYFVFPAGCSVQLIKALIS